MKNFIIVHQMKNLFNHKLKKMLIEHFNNQLIFLRKMFNYH